MQEEVREGEEKKASREGSRVGKQPSGCSLGSLHSVIKSRYRSGKLKK